LWAEPDPGSWNDYLLGGSHNSPADQTAAPFRPRSYPDVLRFFGGYNLVEPGLVHVSRWQPDTPEEAAQADQVAAYGGVGRKQ
jgi:hypothetical protein